MIKTLLSTVLIFLGFMAQSQYCMTGGPSSTADSNLESLVLTGASGGINYTGCPGVIGVEEFLSQTTVLNAGAAYVLTVAFGTCGGNYAGVGEAWIDFNSNGVFEPSESLLTWQGTPPMVAGNYVFNVPAASMNGQTRMRVIQAEGQALPLDPCSSSTWGSVTDFVVEIQNGVDCSGYVGDDISDPRIVPSIPFSENYDNSFCYSNQSPAYNSPDVFYLVEPGALTSLNASLCGSSFDTYISVQNKYGVVIAQNDDYAGCGGTQSEVNFSTVGHDTVYIVVEGWGTEMGSYTLTIGEGIVGMDELSNDPFKIYPNPATGSFKLEGNYIGEVQILNTEGKVVLSEYVEAKNEINISTLSSGFYIVRLTSDTRVYDKKLIIE